MASRHNGGHVLRFCIFLLLAVALVASATSEDEKCTQPEGDSCTDATPDETRAAGFGVYYQYPCHDVGCNFYRPYCRLCANHHFLIDLPYPKCPECVAKLADKSEKSIPDDESACELPQGHSCTGATPHETRAAGLGVYYESPCRGVGCNFMGAMCRLCAKHPKLFDRPYPACPKCVT